MSKTPPRGRHTVRPMLSWTRAPVATGVVPAPQIPMLIHIGCETLRFVLGRFTGIKQLIM